MTTALVEAIDIVATDLERERLDQVELKTKLALAIEEFNRAMTANELARKALGLHLESNEQIAGHLPYDRQIEALLAEIKTKLTEVDDRLRSARQKHEQTIAKIPLTF